jgi:hypothetical protein
MKLYIETSVPNFLFAEDAPEKRRVTELFFDWLKLSEHKVFSAGVVFEELNAAPEGKRDKLLRALSDLEPVLLPMTAEAASLCQVYLDQGILPPRYYNDAIQIALCTCHEMDLLVTWNMRHMANVFRQEKINRANLEFGRSQIKILTPEHLIYED